METSCWIVEPSNLHEIYSPDGIHFSDKGLEKYYRSVRDCLLRVTRAVGKFEEFTVAVQTCTDYACSDCSCTYFYSLASVCRMAIKLHFGRMCAGGNVIDTFWLDLCWLAI